MLSARPISGAMGMFLINLPVLFVIGMAISVWGTTPLRTCIYAMAADYIDNWIVQARKGLLDYCVVSALAEKECYGYELVRSLVEIPGLGVTREPFIRCCRGCGCRAW